MPLDESGDERAFRHDAQPSLARRIEYADHPHEHPPDPAAIESGRYVTPVLPGYSAEMRAETLSDYAFPGGVVWQADEATGAAR